ncbi:hypothetical protein JTB14_000769 [Gonioctena quinquepunctata]|nr:hypothetical protein JTB14_000769 [Gonioctena quinquepunctata]
MLFDGFETKWYQGVKNTEATWTNALALLGTTFGPQKPAHCVYRATEQDSNTPTDIFVCKARPISAQSPTGMLTEEIQLDMVYGLLNRKIREKIKTFTELLTISRLLEETFKRSESVVVKDGQKWYTSSLNSASSCSVSKANVSSLLLCYGCGKPGYIRSDCPTCTVVESSSMDFLSSDYLVSPRPRPIMHVDILGHHGQGAAKQSVAGRMLCALLKQVSQTFSQECIMVKFTEGQDKMESVLVTCVDVRVKDRIVPTKLIIFADAPNKTLFGIDFIRNAEIILEVSDKR